MSEQFQEESKSQEKKYEMVCINRKTGSFLNNKPEDHVVNNAKDEDEEIIVKKNPKARSPRKKTNKKMTTKKRKVETRSPEATQNPDCAAKKKQPSVNSYKLA